MQRGYVAIPRCARVVRLDTTLPPRYIPRLGIARTRLCDFAVEFLGAGDVRFGGEFGDGVGGELVDGAGVGFDGWGRGRERGRPVFLREGRGGIVVLEGGEFFCGGGGGEGACFALLAAAEDEEGEEGDEDDAYG